MDKQTGQPLRDGPSMLSWEKKLRSMCARLGAKFVSYKTDGGVWKFEVRILYNNLFLHFGFEKLV